jgi:hypothetical protein
MGTIALMRAGLATRLDTIEPLRVYPRRPDSINPPAASIKRVRGSERTTFATRGSVWFDITVTVALRDLERAQDELEEYCDLAGSQSIIAALEADETLGGAAECLLIGQWGPDRSVKVGDIDYLEASLSVEVCHI